MLKLLVGRKVTIFSEQGESERQDVGVIEAIEDGWIRFRKGEKEIIYFNTLKIRLLKPFDA